VKPGLLAPSILSFNHAEIRPRVQELIAGGAKLIHLDVMDGQFVPPISFGDGMAKGLTDLEGALFEAHLMIERPEDQLDRFVEAGCKRVIFHAEATFHANRLIGHLHSLGCEAGIAINPATPAEMVREVIGPVDSVLVMTVNPGWGGQPFIESALRKVETIRSWSDDIWIEVDGGIDEQTLPRALDAGANLFVVGSHLLKYPSLGDAVRELSGLCA